jgi:MFS family permease
LRRAVLFSLASVGVGMVFTFFNAQLPLYLRDYGMAHQWIGPLTNERSFAGALVLPVVGRWSDRAHTRWGKRRPFFVAGVPALALLLLGLAFHPPFWIMIALVMLAGGALFVALGPYQAMMADITPPAQRGQIGSLTAGAGLVGSVLISVAAGLWWETEQELVFFATIGVVVAAFALTFWLVPEPAHHTHPSPGGGGEIEVALGALTLEPAVLAEAGSLPGGLAARLRTYIADVRQYRQAGRYIAAMSLYWLAAGGATPFITLYGTETLHLTPNTASSLFLVLVLSTAAGIVVLGFVADRLGRKRVLHAGLALFALAAWAATSVGSVEAALPVMVLAGLGNACPTALGVPLLADLVPRARTGEFLSLASAVWSIVQPLGSFLAGALVDHFGSTRWAFAFAGVFMALSVVALFALPPIPHHGPGDSSST